MGRFREKILKFMKNEDCSVKMKRMVACFCEFLEEVEKENPEVEGRFHEKMEEIFWGPHFTEESLEKALNCIVKRDGSKGRYWSLDQTNDIASQGRLEFDEDFNQYDFCYAMNYCRAKYGESIRNIMGDDSVKIYFELAKAWEPNKKMTPVGSIWHAHNAFKKGKELEEK